MNLERRIVRLERQNRWMKRGAGVVLTSLFLAMILGQSKPQDTIKAKLLEAQAFAVTDNDGKLRGSFGFIDKGSESGSTQLALYDANEKIVLSLTVRDAKHKNGGGPNVLLENADKHGSLWLGFVDDAPAMTLRDKSGFLSFGVTTEGPLLKLLDGKMKTLFEAP